MAMASDPAFLGRPLPAGYTCEAFVLEMVHAWHVVRLLRAIDDDTVVWVHMTPEDLVHRIMTIARDVPRQPMPPKAPVVNDR